MVPTTKEAEMKVMIGIDPHKASHTAVAIGRDEDQIASVKVRATNRQVQQLLCSAEPFEKRTWAIESVGGLGYLLASEFPLPRASRCSTSRPPWPRGSGCSPPGAPTRTTPTTPIRLPSPLCEFRPYGRSSRPITARSFGCFPSATAISGANGPESSAACTRSLPSSPRWNCQGNVRL